MNDNIETASLMPYIETDGTGFHIKMTEPGQDDTAYQKPAFPFLVVSDSAPFSRIIEAEIITDAATQIEPVFLLTQKDDYPLIKDELWLLDNHAIDQYWQHTFAFHTRQPQSCSPLFLKGQISKNGQLLPFQPLLYCKFKKIYFPPLCPDCGASLQQCYNDGLLEGHGLLPYSGSLKRYLYCPSCIDSKEMPDFYVSSMSVNDPGFLKDRFELIKKYGQLREKENYAAFFPCLDCTGYQECYSSENLALSRIAAFSFYPFYMLMFKADSVNALDFISLMSGAPYKAITKQLIAKQQPGRLRRLQVLKQKGILETPFFFIDEDRYFLEVLYLKLSFLKELSETIFSRLDTFQHANLGSSIDRIWIKLTNQNSLLPSFWNFKIELLDVINADTHSLFPKLTHWNGLHFLGTIWFFTLLVNKRQDVSIVYRTIKEAMQKISGDNHGDSEKYLGKDQPQVFSPENIFWDPETIMVNDKQHGLWRASLRMGFDLLDESPLDLQKWPKKNFSQQLEQLRQQIKDKLFSSEKSVFEEELTSNDKAIYEILIKIMRDWQDVEIPKDELASTVSPVDTDITENEIKHADFNSKIATGIFDKRSPKSQEDTDIKETIIITPDDKTAEKTDGVIQTGDPNKTVRIGNADTKSSGKKETAFQTNHDLEKTIRPSDYDREKERKPTVKPAGDPGKTVLLTPGKTEKPDENDLPETLIISPLQRSSESKQVRSSTSFYDIRSDQPSKTDIPRDNGLAGENQIFEKPDKDAFLDKTITIRQKKTDPNKTNDER